MGIWVQRTGWMAATAAAWLTAGDTARAGDFAGWQGLRVIEQDGYPGRMHAADLDGDGDDEIIIVNLRNARLDVYGWKDAAAQGDDQQPAGGGTSEGSGGSGGSGGSDHVNDLPMAREVELTEVPTRQPPIDMATVDTGDGTKAMLVLVSDPNRLLRLTADADGKWSTTDQWELLPGRYAGIGDLIRVLELDDGGTAVLVSCADGIQQLTWPADDADGNHAQVRARWLEPRETIGRMDWWLADLDGDGDRDLIEWTSDASQSLRWYPCSGNELRPAQSLHDRAVGMAVMLQGAEGGDQLLVLESQPEGVVRRFKLAAGDESPLGRREPLALPGGEKAVWATATFDGQTQLVAIDPNQPRVTLYAHDDSGWTAGESYPVIGSVKAMMELPANPGSLVFWPEGGGDLYQSMWHDGRLTYPQAMDLSAEGEETSVLGLGRGVYDLWCVQKSGSDLLLHRIKDLPMGGGSGPYLFGRYTVRFPGAAGKADRAICLDDNTLLVADKFAKGLRLVRLANDPDQPAISSEPPSLAKAKLDEFRLFREWDDVNGETVRIGRLTDGVLQWLDADMRAIDQVMLPDGRRLDDLVLNPDGSAWALQQGGNAIHRLTPDDAGVLRLESSTRLDSQQGRALTLDPSLGLLTTTSQGVTRLAEGRPRQLEVVQSLDARAGRPEGVRDATVHRVFSMDIDGDGRDDALLTDDIRHQLTAMTRSGNDESDEETNDAEDLIPLLSWPVFEDQTYPYGGAGEDQVREPRAIVALDLDGDGHRDLAMMCQDRLQIYLAVEPDSPTANPPASEAQDTP